MIYIARVWLRYTEQEFWKLTARQFFAQYAVHIKLRDASQSDKNTAPEYGFIDQIPGW